jgi:hypothetical protein
MWQADEKYESFIFSLTNNHIFKLATKQNAIYGYTIYNHYVFQIGCDIAISNKSN